MKTRANLVIGVGRALAFTLLLSAVTWLPNVTGAEESSPAAQHMPGLWQKHQYSFQFLGFTSTYSCDGLADTLKLLLLAAGARADAKAQPGACAAPLGRPDKFARADLTFYTLAPVGTGSPADTNQKPVDGVWRSVTIADRSPIDLRIGDCEVVEQFRDHVLPMFTTRNVVYHTTCVPHQESGSLIDLRFDSFMAAKTKGAASPKGAAPAADTPH